MVGPGRQPAEGHTMAVEQLQAVEAERASVNDVLNALEELFGKEPEKGFRWFHLCGENIYYSALLFGEWHFFTLSCSWPRM